MGQFYLSNFKKVSELTGTVPSIRIAFFPFFYLFNNFMRRVTSPPYSFAVTSFLKAFMSSLATTLPPTFAYIAILNNYGGKISFNRLA